jgi:Gluconate 2-dehydrogenase subunit 3
MAALTSWASGDAQKSGTCITGVGGSIEFQQQRRRRHRPLGGLNNLSESSWAKSFPTGVLGPGGKCVPHPRDTQAVQPLNPENQMTASQKQKVVELLKSIETGDAKPVAYINPNTYIQHNLAIGDGLAGFGEVLQKLPRAALKSQPCASSRMAMECSLIPTIISSGPRSASTSSALRMKRSSSTGITCKRCPLRRTPVATPVPARFLNEAERHFLESAVDRLIPPDERWPGATEAGVVNYIDLQMGGAWG